MFDHLKLLYYLIRPRTIFLRHFSKAFGDNLLLTCILPELRKNNPDSMIIVKTARKEFIDIFRNNPYADWVTDKHFKTTKKFIKPKYRLFPDTRTSIYEQMMTYAGGSGKCHPELYLDNEEKRHAAKDLPGEYITVCPVGKMKFSANRKEWGFENFADLSKRFEIPFVQIGGNDDPLIEGAVDRRGLKIRESAAVISNSLLFVGLEGGLMHLSRSVGIPSVIIYGGAIDPAVSSYDENINVSNLIDCSPCFTSEKKHTECHTMECMKGITVDLVEEAVNTRLNEIKIKKDPE